MPFVICITELYHAWNKIAPALIQSNKVSSKSSSHSSLLDIYFLDNFVVLFLPLSLGPNWEAFNFKMARYCSTAYSLFFVSVVLATAIADRCQIVLLNRCKAAYKDALDATSTSQGGHCFRLQVWREKSLRLLETYSSFDVYCFLYVGAQNLWIDQKDSSVNTFQYTKPLRGPITSKCWFGGVHAARASLISIKAMSAMFSIT